MSSIHVYIHLDDTSKVEQEAILPLLTESHKADNIQWLNKHEHIEVSFRYHISQQILSDLLKKLATLEISVIAIFLHMPTEISGIRDIYDLQGRGRLLEEQLLKVDGVLQVQVAPSGVIKLQTDVGREQEVIILDITNAILEFKHKSE